MDKRFWVDYLEYNEKYSPHFFRDLADKMDREGIKTLEIEVGEYSFSTYASRPETEQEENERQKKELDFNNQRKNFRRKQYEELKKEFEP